MIHSRDVRKALLLFMHLHKHGAVEGFHSRAQLPHPDTTVVHDGDVHP